MIVEPVSKLVIMIKPVNFYRTNGIELPDTVNLIDGVGMYQVVKSITEEFKEGDLILAQPHTVQRASAWDKSIWFLDIRNIIARSVLEPEKGDKVKDARE